MEGLELPPVCFIDDVARAIKTSRRTIERRRKHGAFPIPELPGVDKRPRWSREDVQRYLEGQRKFPLRRSA
jgi:hypothetical protein